MVRHDEGELIKEASPHTNGQLVVGVDLRCLQDRFGSGVATYTRLMLRAIKESPDHGFQWQIFTSGAKRPPAFSAISSSSEVKSPSGPTSTKMRDPFLKSVLNTSFIILPFLWQIRTTLYSLAVDKTFLNVCNPLRDRCPCFYHLRQPHTLCPWRRWRLCLLVYLSAFSFF